MIRRIRPLLFSPPAALAAMSFTLGACEGAIPEVKTSELVIPDRSPSRTVQALSSPSTSNTSSGSNSQAFCFEARPGLQQQNDDGTYVYETDCTPGGGVSKIRNEGSADENGNGNYDQITFFEDGSQGVWHFSHVTTPDFLTTTYTGESDDGNETYQGVYSYRADGRSDMNEVWNLDEGTYVTEGIVGSDGSFEGTQTFDDPHTAVSPDWTTDSVALASGAFSQDVHFVGDSFVSDYTYTVDESGNSTYAFATDMDVTQVSPDYEGEYSYAVDGSGSGFYAQAFDDGSSLNVDDVIAADGSVVESWTFDDSSTDQPVDQEGSITWSSDGSGEGTITSHVVGGGDQVCDISVSADGVQTIDCN